MAANNDSGLEVEMNDPGQTGRIRPGDGRVALLGIVGLIIIIAAIWGISSFLESPAMLTATTPPTVKPTIAFTPTDKLAATQTAPVKPSVTPIATFTATQTEIIEPSFTPTTELPP
jgi:hypothetical protein